MYFALTISATAVGVCYAMAVDGMKRKGFRWIWAVILSVLITPCGALIVSLALKEAPPPALHTTDAKTNAEHPKT